MLPERPMVPERIVEFRPRTIAAAAGTVLAIAAALWVLYLAHRVLTWVLISAFLALAMDPAVRSLQRRGVRSRAAAAGVVYLIVFAGIAALSALFIPTLISQVNDFVDAVPGYVRDLTHGRGSLGFLETKYHVVERVQKAVDGRGADGASTALSVGRTLVTGVAATVTIVFMTFFMLLEGPSWLERLYGVVPRRDEAAGAPSDTTSRGPSPATSRGTCSSASSRGPPRRSSWRCSGSPSRSRSGSSCSCSTSSRSPGRPSARSSACSSR